MATSKEQPTINRWLVVAGGIIIQLCLGAIYAWSAFTNELLKEPFQFSKTETQIVFALGLFSFAIVMALFAGRLLKRWGPRITTLIGGTLMGGGYILAGLSGTSFLAILFGIGFLGGAGIGIAYVCPIATLVKWFPDKKGMITGMAVAGFGFGALIWIKLTQGFLFGPFNLSPGWNGLYGMGWSVNDIFLLYGILFTILVAIGSSVMINPQEGWQPEGWSKISSNNINGDGDIEYSVSQMVKTPQFWMLFSAFLVGSTAGLMVIGVIKLFGVDSLAENGIRGSEADLITGTAMGFFYALFNGLGRILWGAISDRIGRKNAIILVNGIQGIVMILFFSLGNTEWGLYLCSAAIGFNYGGNFALFPAATADFFGNKSVGSNYPWVFLAYGVGGVIGPMIGGIMGDAKIWMWAFIPAGIACLAASIASYALTPPKHDIIHQNN